LIQDPKHKTIWSKSAANEFGRLVQGVGGRVKGTDTIKLIKKDDVPYERWKDVTYVSFTCEVRLHEEEQERTRLTTGGDCINYPDNIRDTHSRHDTLEMFCKQHHLHIWSKMYHAGYQGILFKYTYET
jgi:hypothetical protein